MSSLFIINRFDQSNKLVYLNLRLKNEYEIVVHLIIHTLYMFVLFISIYPCNVYRII